MRSYAVLGGTGATGSRITKQLLQEEDVHLNVYARSRQRLEAKIPLLATSSRVQIFTGSITNIEILADCLSGVDAVFATVGTNVNEPGCSVAQEVSSSIVAALLRLRSQAPRNVSTGAAWTCPTLVFLSSTGVNPLIFGKEPFLLRFIVARSCSYIYHDLKLAEKYLRGHDWVPLVFVQPGAIVHDQAYGARLAENEATSRVSYEDLASAMIMAAEGKVDGSDDTSNRRKWTGKSIGVVSLGGERVVPAIRNLKYLIPGLVWYFLPFLWHWSKFLGLH
ncbi:hypothetical protein ETB97_003686 [Aspergillus alliaceus]|uniref:NAD(P)-binding domain-containing protein n=1 Tax=Petromyces alliaceus TaxID=209559 RepID=A0A8H6EB66_PETAA|nr:hypothetical protein ETB97_003686 [Aspergillus burnettii]